MNCGIKHTWLGHVSWFWSGRTQLTAMTLQQPAVGAQRTAVSEHADEMQKRLCKRDLRPLDWRGTCLCAVAVATITRWGVKDVHAAGDGAGYIHSSILESIEVCRSCGNCFDRMFEARGLVSCRGYVSPSRNKGRMDLNKEWGRVWFLPLRSQKSKNKYRREGTNNGCVTVCTYKREIVKNDLRDGRKSWTWVKNWAKRESWAIAQSSCTASTTTWNIVEMKDSAAQQKSDRPMVSMAVDDDNMVRGEKKTPKDKTQWCHGQPSQGRGQSITIHFAFHWERLRTRRDALLGVNCSVCITIWFNGMR